MFIIAADKPTIMINAARLYVKSKVKEIFGELISDGNMVITYKNKYLLMGFLKSSQLIFLYAIIKDKGNKIEKTTDIENHPIPYLRKRQQISK
jgi:hypothetical protein